MPELGKATYFLIADTRQFDAGMAHADEVSLASTNTIGRSMDKTTASVNRMATSSGVAARKIGASEAGIAEAATVESRAVTKAHAAAESSYVRLSATGTKAYERLRLGPLAAVAVTAYEGAKTLKENIESSALLDRAFKNAGASAYITRDAMNELTDSQEKNSLFTRAQIQLTERLALGYRDITDKARFVKAATDAAAYSHKGLQMITLALGRALENPAMGLSKLTRAGISFNQSQIDMAKHITETQGKAAGMAYVFAQVESRVRGSAKAAADAAPWVQLWKQFKEISATLVAFILPPFRAFLGILQAHTTTLKVFAGGLLLIATAYIAVHTAQKAMELATTIQMSVMSIYNRVTGATAAAELERARAARVAMVAEEELATMTEAATAGLTALQFAADKVAFSMQRMSVAELEAAAASGEAGAATAASRFAAALSTIINPVTLVIAGVIALGFAIHKLKGYWDEAKKAQKAVASDQNVALTAYAHEVNRLVGQGMDKTQARIKADTDVFNRLGRHVGATFVDGVGKSITEGATKLEQKVKEIMKGLTDNVDNSMAAYAAAQRGGNITIMKAAGDVVSKAQSDLRLGMQGATDILIGELQKQQDKVQEKTDAMMNHWGAQIDLWRGRLKDAFTNLSTVVFQAFDAATDAGLKRFDTALETFKTRVQTALDVATKKIDAALKMTMAKLQAQQDALTPAEAQLKALQDQASAVSRNEALADAQAQLAGAKTPAERAQAERQLRNAQLAIQEAALEQQAAIERDARNKEIEAAREAAQQKADDQKAAYAAQLQKQQDAYEARISAAKRDYASERALYKEHLQKWLNQELAWLQKHPQQWKRVFNDLVKVFGPDVRNAATLIGRGFIGSFRDAVNTAATASLKLSKAMHNASVRVGQALANGIVSGLRYLAPDLYNEMNRSLAKAIADFKKAHGINSPARTTIEQIGMPLGEGIVVGIERSTRGLFSGISVPNLRGLSLGSTSSPSTSMPNLNSVAGEGGALSRGGTTIQQFITRVDPDPMQLLQEAKHAAEGVFG